VNNRRVLVVLTLSMLVCTIGMAIVSARYNKAANDVETEAERIVMRERLKNEGDR
jgi:hypothetical protein